ncbi:hypothetical protein Mgra_00008442 [Meloidogyne graminicola]|uniref:Abnormal cell migration protein 18-like fibronectin type I domain-containing protein n=1 Tax=Meloidogyne graminicola TaxID=189291 RepID=A0A8S9ZFS8_9BILA|nr:hypothetical protein Mgra_00008442 [Meloidogyne graminicola]
MFFTLLFILFVSLLNYCALQKHELSSSHMRLGPRYQILKEFGFTGQKNVRYETRPIEFQDVQGNPIDASKFVGTNKGCIDMEGINHPEGVEYDRQNKHFKYRCNNGQEEVAACIGSDRTDNARIPVGETLNIKGYWHKCMKYPNGSTKTGFDHIERLKTTSCSTERNEYRVGEEILLGNLRMVCGDQGYNVIGCYFYNKGQVQKLNVGEQQQIGKVTHFCEAKGNTLQYYSTGAGGCMKAGKEYSEGDVYSINHLRYKCHGGIMDVTGCYIEENRDLSIGQDIVEKGMVYRCYRLGPKIEYTEYACGFRGTPSCTPEAIPKTPDQVPALGRGLISPGFKSFSIVETAPGTQQVKYPSSINLQLQKKPQFYASNLNDKGKVVLAKTEPQNVSIVNSKLNPFVNLFFLNNCLLNTTSNGQTLNKINGIEQILKAKKEENYRETNQTKDEVKNKVNEKNEENKFGNTWTKIAAVKEPKGYNESFPPLPSNQITNRTKIMEGGLQQNFKNILTTNNKASSSNTPYLRSPVNTNNFKKETFMNFYKQQILKKTKMIGKFKTKMRKKELLIDEEEFDWEKKEDFGVDWGLGIKNLEIKDRTKCEAEDEWEDGECILNDRNDQTNDKPKIEYKSDSDLDWEEKADREIDWKIENMKDSETNSIKNCESSVNSDWEGECKMGLFVSFHPLQTTPKMSKNKVDNNKDEIKINKVKSKGKNVHNNENDLDWEQKADLLDQINWKNGFKKIKKSEDW